MTSKINCRDIGNGVPCGNYPSMTGDDCYRCDGYPFRRCPYSVYSYDCPEHYCQDCSMYQESRAKLNEEIGRAVSGLFHSTYEPNSPSACHRRNILGAN